MVWAKGLTILGTVSGGATLDLIHEGGEFEEVCEYKKEVEPAEDHVHEHRAEVHGSVSSVADPQIDELEDGAHGSESEVLEEDHHDLSVVEAVEEFPEFE